MPRRKASEPAPPADNREISLVLREDYGVRNWDLAVVGDGSGQGWEYGCGWACVLIDGLTQQRTPFWGAFNQGSVNLAESMPYLQAITWFAAVEGGKRKELLGRTLEVHCISDSKVTCTHGNAVVRETEEASRILRKFPQWNVLHGLKANGYHFRFHWKPRAKLGLNILADYVAAAARISLTGIALPAVGGQPLTPYDVNSTPRT